MYIKNRRNISKTKSLGSNQGLVVNENSKLLNYLLFIYLPLTKPLKPNPKKLPEPLKNIGLNQSPKIIADPLQKTPVVVGI